MAADKTPKDAPAAEPVPTQAYDVISPLEHDGVSYAIGDAVDLTDAQAERLLGKAIAPKAQAASQEPPAEST